MLLSASSSPTGRPEKPPPPLALPAPEASGTSPERSETDRAPDWATSAESLRVDEADGGASGFWAGATAVLSTGCGSAEGRDEPVGAGAGASLAFFELLSSSRSIAAGFDFCGGKPLSRSSPRSSP